MKLERLMVLGLLLALCLWLLPLVAKDSMSAYNSTALVNTTVNITNAAPLVTKVRAPTPINLVGYANQTVVCNVTTFDFDNDTLKVNASFHLSSVSPVGAVDQNFRYLNTSCTQLSAQNEYINWSCGFRVNYFATNGTWYCNSTAIDTAQTYGTNRSNAATLNPLVAIKLTPVIDFGDIPTENISAEQIANVTNAGNRNANISVAGFGVNLGDNLAMVCSSGSIPVGYERYDIVQGSPFAFMVQLTGSSVMLNPYFVPQRTSETADSYNRTYWRIEIPTGVGGVCNGKLLFSATDRLS